jgi:hypothetical protein
MKMFGKASEVYISGLQYPPRKLKKASYGKAYVSTIDCHSGPAGM